jgi:predicted homoserine dehydrogenase-like protein
MGRGMVSQMFCMKGICPVIISDLNVERAKNVYVLAGSKNDDIVLVGTVSEAEAAIKNGNTLLQKILM